MTDEKVSEFKPTIDRIGALSNEITAEINAGHSLASVSPQKNELDRRINGLTHAKHPAISEYGRAAKSGFTEVMKLQEMREAGDRPCKIRRQFRKVSEKQNAIQKAAQEIGRFERKEKNE